VLIRILFLVGLFAGGFTLLLYIALWVLLPEAKTASDKLRMRGSAVTLSALDSNLRGAPTYTDADGQPVAAATNRPVGVFLENSFQNVRPLVNLVGAAIRIFAGGLLVLIGFSLLLAFVIMLGVGLGMIPESDNIVMGAMPAYTFFNGASPFCAFVPAWPLCWPAYKHGSIIAHRVAFAAWALAAGHRGQFDCRGAHGPRVSARSRNHRNRQPHAPDQLPPGA
jgi:hypothetical protein